MITIAVLKQLHLTLETRDPHVTDTIHSGLITHKCVIIGNDPSAGSPTETLLRLLLPLNDQV